jgi:hypothetical protein
MKNKNLIATSILAVVLLSGTFISLAAADDNIPDVTAPLEPLTTPDQTQRSPSDNSNGSPNDNTILFTIEDNRTVPDENPNPEVPGAEDANLIATQTNSDNTLPAVAVAIVLAVVLGAIGVLFYHRKVANAQN